MSLRYRSELDAIAAYRPGPPAPVRDQPTYKLSSNENPFAPLPSVVQAVVGQLDELNRYPQMAADQLVAALAASWSVSADEIVVGAGSV
ncbi:MAG: aminotransferase, partial [Propionibacteriaceae bacterium]|nr:aminotransferase [Propionibacteriaceae bacterium]